MPVLAAIGVDVGSSTCKAVAVASDGAFLDQAIEPTAVYVQAQAEALVAKLRATIAQDDPNAAAEVPVVATGSGRRVLDLATATRTEISCHARGVYAALGCGGLLVDIGGQDSKAIRVGPKGQAVDFVMNDKCAAGTGRFLENTAQRLGIPIERLGPMSLESSEEAEVSSTCAVFAESEIVSLLARGQPLGSILRGLHRALVSRLVAMMHNLGITIPIMLSGGVALNPAVCELLRQATGTRVLVPEQPRFMGAYGAALMALDDQR